jgi:four helix bundle protein
MSNIKNYKDLIVWQRAHENDVMVIELIEGFKNCIPLNVIGRQLMKSITSISANIAEGHGSFVGKEYSTFLNYALRSAYESDNWLTLLADSPTLNGRYDKVLLESIQSRNIEIIKMLSTILKKLRKSL